MGIQDEKTVEATILDSKIVNTFERLMTELAELEARIQQSAAQSASLRVKCLQFFIYFQVVFSEIEMKGSNCFM